MSLRSVLRSVGRFFTHGWQLKLSAFALALLLWVVVKADQPSADWRAARVEVQVLDPEWRIVEASVPRTVDVLLVGPGRDFWELAISPPRLRVEIRNVTDTVQVIPLDPRMARLPGGLTLVSQDVRPSTLRLNFERLASATVPVEVRVASPFGPDVELIDAMSVDPAEVRVFGPVARVRAVASVQTRPVDLSREETAFVRTVAIDTSGLSGLDLSHREVVLSGRVERRVARALTGVPVATRPGTIAVPAQVDVRIEGPETLVIQLDPAEVRAVVLPDSLPPLIPVGGVSVPIIVDRLPAGLRAVATPSRVRVISGPEAVTTGVEAEIGPQPQGP
jgi:YbbR domain-containing protein